MIAKTKLVSVRSSMGLSQARLGARADVHPANISAIEHRQRPCWPALRKRISSVLGIAETELFNEQGWALEDTSEPLRMAR
ncbi:MAG: hypothetical protein A4E55_02263 [Pelotomaculum sp. PtaU1.Bin035]|nr:MAG: hypothetical protein A4E55_02263 [Pelotomaculum sp. PtaU1.Bin035]